MTSPEAPDLTGIIVTYRSAAYVAGAIESLRRGAAEAGLALELVVVDNASGDGTAEAVRSVAPEAVLFENDRNTGFGVANNQASAVARGPVLVLLNPDARLEPGSLPRLYATLKGDAKLAAVGPSVVGGGTSRAESAGELPGIRSLAAHFLFLNRLVRGDRPGPWRGWQLQRRTGTGVRPVGWISGAALLVRRDALQGVGGFDESIFLYGEDLDLGARLGDAGWHLAIDSRAVATHEIGRSQSPGSTKWIDGIDGYLRRRRRRRPARVASLIIIALGLVARLAVSTRQPGTDPTHRLRLARGARHALFLALRVAVTGD